MPLDYDTIEILRANHPAWRLLRSDHAALIVSFLNRAFIESRSRNIPEADLIEALEDQLFQLRERLGQGQFPRLAKEYLNEWVTSEKAWLRKFYPKGNDVPHYDLTPATEKAIAWLDSLADQAFIGTESRLLTLFELLRQMGEGSETDPSTRLIELRKRRDEIDNQISRVVDGDLPMLDGPALRDRFLQFTQLAKELLGDFRQVEVNFRQLDRTVRERIALWEGGKGTLLEDIMGERDVIADSDQGRSFHAFWDFLMSSRRQDELKRRLEQILELPALSELNPDPALRKVHYDWLEAGEHTQRTVAELSKQLRRFLDDKAWLENRRIMDLLHRIETKALMLRDSPPSAPSFMEIADVKVSVDLPFERPLHRPATKVVLKDTVEQGTGDDVDPSALYGQHVVDKAVLAGNIRQCLNGQSQISLHALAQRYPLTHGLAELVTYLDLGSVRFQSAVDESHTDSVRWAIAEPDGAALEREATLARVIFIK